ncbi:Uncharacterised protein r2_g290 [Pycnogonum litorale]
MNEPGISLRKSKCSGEERCNIENMRLIDKSEKMWKSEEIKSVKNIQKFLENNSEIPSGYYTILDENTDRLMILYISIDDHVPHIHISIMVSNDLVGFGWYRQMSGANYYISVKQVLESERKIKTLSLMKFSKVNIGELDVDFSVSLSDNDKVLVEEAISKMDNIFSIIDESDMNATYYVAGALVRSELRARRCKNCEAILTEDVMVPTICESKFEKWNSVSKKFTDDVSRGGLVAPSEIAFNICLKSFNVFSAIQNSDLVKNKFLKAESNRLFFRSLVIESGDQISISDCTQNHNFQIKLIDRFFNCCVKNFVCNVNLIEPDSKKRKINKLQNKGND